MFTFHFVSMVVVAAHIEARNCEILRTFGIMKDLRWKNEYGIENRFNEIRKLIRGVEKGNLLPIS